MTTKMKWHISRRLGIFLTINPTHLPSTITSFIFLVTFPSYWYVHSGDPSGAPLPQKVPPHLPQNSWSFRASWAWGASQTQDPGHQTFGECFSPGEWKPPTSPSKILSWGAKPPETKSEARNTNEPTKPAVSSLGILWLEAEAPYQPSVHPRGQ